MKISSIGPVARLFPSKMDHRVFLIGKIHISLLGSVSLDVELSGNICLGRSQQLGQVIDSILLIGTEDPDLGSFVRLLSTVETTLDGN